MNANNLSDEHMGEKMTEKIIRKKIRVFYVIKMILIIGLLISLFSMIGFTISYTISNIGWLGNLAVFSYAVIIVFAILSVFFPINKYNIKSYIHKNDINIILDYLADTDCSDGEYLERLLIIKRTARELTNDHAIMKWEHAIDQEAIINDAWDTLYIYLQQSDLLHQNCDDVKEYVIEIKKGLHDGKIDHEKLNELKKKKSISSRKKIRKTPRLNVVFTVSLAIILLGIVIFKFWVILKGIPTEDIANNLIANIAYQTGADIIALLFAFLSINSEIKRD